MKTRSIPRTSLTASVLCLGAAEFGSAIDDSTSEEILETYLDAGGNVLDTAEIYAAWLPTVSIEAKGFWVSGYGNAKIGMG
jgi:aryl-alcohol dehydrogenase-like predicted oxidoreductase